MKKSPCFGGSGKEYINALTKLYSAHCETPIRATTQPHRLPPYGRQLSKLRPTPADELRIYFGTDVNEIWTHTRKRNIYAPPALLLPPGTRAESFSWPVCGWPVFAIQNGDYSIEEIRKLAHLILQSGALIFRVLYGENPDLAIFRPAYKKVTA